MQEHEPTQECEVGIVTHYWSHIGVAGVHLEAPVDVGDRIHVAGHSDDFEQTVDSIEIDHRPVVHADAGVEVGIRMAAHAHEHDRIYKV
jgi:hypothetical protein